MKTKQIKFRYKGNRNYIQGADLFHIMMQEIQANATHQNICFTIHDFITSSTCQLYITQNKTLLSSLTNIAVRCQVEIDNTPHWLAISPALSPASQNQASEQRDYYDESLITSLCIKTKKSIHINHLSPYNFIETIVAMTKHLHQQLYPDIIGKWVFTRIDLTSFYDVQKDITITLQHNMNNKLTKSDIMLSNNKIGDIFFSLVQR